VSGPTDITFICHFVVGFTCACHVCRSVLFCGAVMRRPLVIENITLKKRLLATDEDRAEVTDSGGC